MHRIDSRPAPSRADDTRRVRDAARDTEGACRTPPARSSLRPIALAVPLMLLSGDPIPLNDITVRGSVQPDARQVTGTIGTAVAIPFGKVPVTGRTTARYECDGSFAGTVSYSWLIRLAARLKGIDLVTTVDGTVETALPWDCAAAEGSLFGQLKVSGEELKGYMRYDGDSVAVGGFVRTVGDSAYYAVLSPIGGGYTARINLYERRSERAPEPGSEGATP